MAPPNETAPEDCPDPSVHGNPFRYCPNCTWTETPEPISPGPVRVGVRRWAGDEPAESGEAHTGYIGPAWLEVVGVRIPGEVLLQSSHEFDGADDNGLGIGVVTVRVLCTDYQLVDHETGEPIA
jgi:hypothetical protein